MEHCLNHPETATSRRCALCEQPFCGACLEVVEGAGAVCVECEQEISAIPVEERQERMPTLREEIQRSLPRPRPWWGWTFLFWVAVATPSIATGAYLYDLYRYHQFLSFLSREPVLPGITLGRLVDVSTALERYRMENGQYPDDPAGAIGEVEPEQATSRLADPYSFSAAPFLYRKDGDRYRLCSVGPDRLDDHGAPLDRFTGRGDICVGLPMPR